MSPIGIALLLAAGPASVSTPVGGVIIERVLAVVRNPASAAPRPLTQGRLEEEARIALVGQGGAAAAFGPLDDAARRAALRWVIDQWLVADEVQRLKVEEVSAQEIEAAKLAFRGRFPDQAGYQRFLASLELREEGLASILARGVRVQRFLETRLGRGGRITDDEVTRVLAGQGLAVPTPAEREAARARLSAERAQGQVKVILADLWARADVRVLAPELREEPAR